VGGETIYIDTMPEFLRVNLREITATIPWAGR
jgi:hypothetical protein